MGPGYRCPCVPERCPQVNHQRPTTGPYGGHTTMQNMDGQQTKCDSNFGSHFLNYITTSFRLIYSTTTNTHKELNVVPQPCVHKSIFKSNARNLFQLLENDTNVHGTRFMPPGATADTRSLYEHIWELGIETFTVMYRPIEEREPDDETIYCKNLFLKDRRGALYLVLCPEEAKVNLKALKTKLGAYRNFSFVPAEETRKLLGVGPGEITPLVITKQLSILNTNFRLIFFKSLTAKHVTLNFHPFEPKYALRMSFADFNKCLLKSLFMNQTNCQFEVIPDV